MATEFVDPFSCPSLWDAINIGGVYSPGVCVVSGFTRDFEFDVKKGKGALGGTLTFVGRPPAEGSVKFLLWELKHFQQWAAFRKLLKYDPTKKAVKAIDIFHPALADLEIYSVVCKSLSAMEHDGDGLYSCTAKLLEYFPPPKTSAVSTPAGSTGTSPAGAPGTTPAAAPDAQQAEIDRLLKAAQAP